jgi:sugar phosphate isomerase/epimerase
MRSEIKELLEQGWGPQEIKKARRILAEMGEPIFISTTTDVDPEKLRRLMADAAWGPITICEQATVTVTAAVDVETLARDLHEAGREAVEKGATVAAAHHGEKTRTFLGWDEITEEARDGRRIQARWLLDHYHMNKITP